jgi:hypothetical protein
MKLKTFLICIIAIVAISLGIKTLSSLNNTSSISPTPAPVAQKPATPDKKPSRDLAPNEQFISPVGLYITVPDGMTFRKEIADDSGVIRSVGFYIEKNDGTYKLYGLYQEENITDDGLERIKKEMNPLTIRETVVGGYKGVEGQIEGPRARYATYIIKDSKPISFSTIPYTEENKAITEQILSTATFE